MSFSVAFTPNLIFFLIKRVNCSWNILPEEAILSSDLLSLRGKSSPLSELEEGYDTKTWQSFCL